jgi:sulfur relay (sulfurtransferase) DsrC/TusE family protein
MANIEVNGKSYETDEEGYLVNLGEWDVDVANYIAGTENITMTDQHWEVVNFLREYFKKLGPEKGTSEYLYGLYPYGPGKQACKIAGLPKPTGCI